MNGKEYMMKNFTKEELVERLDIDNCPRDFGFETELSANKDYCNDSCQGDCKACWNSQVKNYSDTKNMKQFERIQNEIQGFTTAMEVAGYLEGVRTATLVWCKENAPEEVYEKEIGKLEVSIYGKKAYLESEV